MSLLYTTTGLLVPLIPKTNQINNYEKQLLFTMIILYYKTHMHICYTLIQIIIILIIIQIIIILIIIMLLIWIKDPHVLLPCLYNVSFLFFVLSQFNNSIFPKYAALISAYIVTLIWFSRDFCFGFTTQEDVWNKDHWSIFRSSPMHLRRLEKYIVFLKYHIF